MVRLAGAMSGTEPRPLHVLEIETFGRGGLVHYACNLARALAERGHHVTLATAVDFELGDRLDGLDNFTVVEIFARIERRFGSWIPGPLLALWRKFEALLDGVRIATLVARLSPDIVHLHSTNPVAALYLRILAWMKPTLVVTAHVVTPHEPIPLGRWIYGRIHALGDLVIAHSRFDERRLVEEFGVQLDRLAVIPHGEYGFFARDVPAVDRSVARGALELGQNDEVALFFGYIREYKGLDVLFDAWPAVARERPTARLVVAGDPVQLSRERRAELARRADTLGVVHHFGYVPFADVGTYFAAADALVMPYRHISQSGVLYLALALGLPVIATRVGALPELLEDGESAILVPSESPDELGQAIARALGDNDLRMRLAEGGSRLAREHSWPAVAERTESFFHKVMDRGQRVIT
jgi:glycosyltransferase involved in cell wall biosynthesis